MNGIEIGKRILDQEYGALYGSEVFALTESQIEKYISECGILESMDEQAVRERLEQIGLSHSIGNARLVKISADFIRAYPYSQTLELTLRVK